MWFIIIPRKTPHFLVWCYYIEGKITFLSAFVTGSITEGDYSVLPAWWLARWNAVTQIWMLLLGGGKLIKESLHWSTGQVFLDWLPLGFFLICMCLGLLICLWGFSVCFKVDFIFKHVTDPFPNRSYLKHDTFHIEDYINFKTHEVKASKKPSYCRLGNTTRNNNCWNGKIL